MTLTPSHPGVHSGNFRFPPALPWLHTNLRFSNVSLPGSCLFFDAQHKCFLGPAPHRQTPLSSSPPPALSNELLSKKNITLSQLFFPHKFFPKATGVSGPLQSIAGRAVTEPSSLFSTGVTGGMIILPGLIIPCLWLQHPTLLHLRATLLAHQVLPHSWRCWHFPKLLLERPLAHLTSKKPFSALAPTLSQQQTVPSSSSVPTAP